MIKIHIDNINNEDGKIWGVRDGNKYYRVHGILVMGLYLETRTSKRQPRAYLRGQGVVQIVKIQDAVIAVIKRK